MRIAMIGLGRMGGNMTRRLRRRGIEVVGYNRSREVVEQLQREEGMIAADSVLDAVKRLAAPRVVWLMLPAGDVTEQQIDELCGLLEPGDI
ncbi:MAG TPA: NAD(P)-binding domain-containing protein, partial [Gammaproteobacteria bacterium]